MKHLKLLKTLMPFEVSLLFCTGITGKVPRRQDPPI